ncbi:uncharacterized protein LJ264_006497 [Porphyrio hochstetteri]
MKAKRLGVGAAAASVGKRRAQGTTLANHAGNQNKGGGRRRPPRRGARSRRSAGRRGAAASSAGSANDKHIGTAGATAPHSCRGGGSDPPGLRGQRRYPLGGRGGGRGRTRTDKVRQADLHPCAPRQFLNASAEREDAEIRQDWYLEPFQLTAPSRNGNASPDACPAGQLEPTASYPGVGKVFAATVWISSSAKVANLPASARLESRGKVLGASRKWLFGCPRHCSTFLDADPAAQEPFQRTGLGQLFLERAATDLERQQQQPPGCSRQPPGLTRIPAGSRQRGRGGGDAMAPACTGGHVSSASRRYFRRVSCKYSSFLALLRDPRLHSRGGQSIPSGRAGTGRPVPRAAGCRFSLVPQLRSRARGLSPSRDPSLLRTPRSRGPSIARWKRMEKKP